MSLFSRRTGDFQNQLDQRAIELSAATQERQIQHEKICGERYEEGKQSFSELKSSMEERGRLVVKLHEENKVTSSELAKSLNTIKLTLATATGGGAIIAFLASSAGHNVMVLLSKLGE